MAGYDDTRNKILESLLQRPVGTEINPENHQDFALSLLDYIRSVELISGSTLIGIAYQDTVPVQSNNSNGVYIAGVAQGSTVVFQNFRDVNGNQLTVTTEDTESKLVILIWNRQYWSKHEISANVVSQAENAYYNLTIRKQYESVNAMNSDKKSPIGNDGRAIRRGEIVSVRNPSNSNENGLYSYELNEYKIPYWQLQTKLSTLADRIIDGGGASGRLDLIKNRRDTNENWEEQNPVLAEGEIGFVVDKNYYKIGDGVSSWKNLQRIGYYDVDINKWLEYDRKNIYSLQEGAGCLQFDGFTEGTGLGGIINTKDSYSYKVLYSTTSKSFILSVVDESDGIRKKVGIFLFWPEIKTETKTIPSSESYKRRDVLFYIFTPNVGSVYYYIDDDGNASEKSSTYIIKKQLDSVKNSIIKKATVEYYDHSVTDGPNRINTRANIKFLDANDNQLFNAVLFGAGNGYPGILSLNDKIKLDNYADTFVNNPVASSESNGLMSVAHVNRINNLEERLLNYVYPKLYQINEGAGARKFDGFYSGNASVTDVRKTEATDGCSYKVVFVRGKFHLQEISPGGVTISLYSEWDRIGDIASSESYAERDKLYYIYVDGEGSTYYYIDNEGIANEASATYLLRRLVDALGANLATAKSVLEAKDAAAEQRIGALENPPAPDYVEMLIEADTAKHYRLFYDVRCIGWLEIDGEEAELPVITEDRAASFYAVLSQGRHVVRFRPKEGNMSDGTPYKEREGLLAWCADNCVTEITLPEGWKVINSKMFEGAATLRRVNLPSTITDVRYGAFGGCRALEEIVLPPSVETIGHIIAHDCPSLKRIVLGGGDIAATGTLAQSCAALECVEFRAGGTVAFSGSANTFINLPQLARFIVRGNLPTFECSQPFTSSGYVGSGAAAEVRWIFTADGEEETLFGNKWRDLIRYCGFTVKKALSYTLL